MDDVDGKFAYGSAFLEKSHECFIFVQSSDVWLHQKFFGPRIETQWFMAAMDFAICLDINQPEWRQNTQWNSLD